MIQLYSAGRCILGLTQENITRLTQGKPIHWQPPKPITQSVMIVFGVDKPAIIAELESAGFKVPESVKQAAKDNPL